MGKYGIILDLSKTYESLEWCYAFALVMPHFLDSSSTSLVVPSICLLLTPPLHGAVLGPLRCSACFLSVFTFVASIHEFLKFIFSSRPLNSRSNIQLPRTGPSHKLSH